MLRARSIIHNWSWILLITFCIVGVFYHKVGVIALICMLAPIVVALFNGRLWCGNFCPRGSFNDMILAKFSRKKKMPLLLKKNWFRNLSIVVLMSAFTIQLTLAWGSYTAVGMVFVRMIILTTLLSIFLGLFYNQRTWCMICPMGTIAHHITKIERLKPRFKHVKFEKDKCIDCKICSRSCPMEINVQKHKDFGKVTDANCLKCNICVEKCPKKSLYVA